MTGSELMAVIGFGAMLFGAISAAFWRMWGLIKEAGDKGEKAQRDLASFRERAAETYATKAGMQEQTAQLLRAIESLGNRIDHIGERIDSIIMQRQTRSRT
jgi:hypothetical protein